jgi:hypothetical protein
MDLESFAVTHSEMSDDLLSLVSDVHANVTITNDRLAFFCETLTHYLACNALCLKPTPTNELLNQSISFSNTFGKGDNGSIIDITNFKTKLGEIYEPLVQRFAAVELYLSKELGKEPSPNKITSKQPT